MIFFVLQISMAVWFLTSWNVLSYMILICTCSHWRGASNITKTCWVQICRFDNELFPNLFPNNWDLYQKSAWAWTRYMPESAQKRELWRNRGRKRPMGMLVVSESDQNYQYNNLYFSLEDILGSEYFLLWSYCLFVGTRYLPIVHDLRLRKHGSAQ